MEKTPIPSTETLDFDSAQILLSWIACNNTNERIEMEPLVQAIPLVQQTLADPWFANFDLDDIREDLKSDLVDFSIELAMESRISLDNLDSDRELVREILQIIADNLDKEPTRIATLVGQAVTGCSETDAVQTIINFWREERYPDELYDNSYLLKDTLVQYLQSADLSKHPEFLGYILKEIPNKWSQDPQNLIVMGFVNVGLRVIESVQPEYAKLGMTMEQLIDKFLYEITHTIPTRHLVF